VTEPRTRQAIDLSGSTEFSDEGGGTIRAYFPLLDIQGRGANEHEAFEALTEQLGALLQIDEQARETFGKWAEDHIIEQEMTPEMIAEEEQMESAATDAGSHFRALTTGDFDEAIASDAPLLVDFWAPWCKPCLMLAPVLAELHDELGFAVAKLNVDEEPDISQRYGVQGIPCMILFKQGAEVGRLVGMAPKAQLRPELVELLAKA
jgi:thioredoxin 1